MSNDSSTETDQRQFWQMAIEAWQSSGLSVRQFCKQEGLSESSFYAWRKRFTPAAAPALGSGTSYPPSAFIQVSLPETSTRGIECVLSSGHTLKIPAGVDRQTVNWP